MSLLSGLIIFLCTLLLLLILTCITWVLYSMYTARRLGLPQPAISSYNPFAKSNQYYGPSPAHNGLVGWVRDRVRIFKNRKFLSGAGGGGTSVMSSSTYERNRARVGHGFSPLDPDEAWDTRVESGSEVYEPNDYYYLNRTPEFPTPLTHVAIPESDQRHGQSDTRNFDEFIAGSPVRYK